MFGKSLLPIVQGHINEILNKDQELSLSRLKICKQCPLYTEGPLGPICDAKKCFDIKLNIPTTGFRNNDAICGCGCRLKAKTTLQNAHCVLDKW